MSRFSKLFLVGAALALASLACGEADPPPTETSSPGPLTQSPSPNIVLKGNRILELDANPPQSGDYDQAMEHASRLGAESIRLSVYWDEIETSPGVFDPDPNWLAIANQYYSAQGFSISLVISVLDTTEVRLPPDLEGKPFSDPVLLERFQDLLEYVHSQLPDVELVSLAIGNEIDGVLGTDLDAWEEYRSFYDPAAAYARKRWPGLPVSTKVTFDGLSGPAGDAAQAIFQNSPLVMTTYYPLESDFTVRDPAAVREDFQTLSDLFPGKEIQITEIGYPTSAANNSSSEKQARFIQNMFLAWDEQADQITLISYSWLSDLPESAVQELEGYYGVSSRSFGEFLRTLGLRTYPGEGEDKAGFEAFQAEAEARGW